MNDQTLIVIRKTKGNFTVKVSKKETGNNYSLFASIYLNKDKMPICGTSFNNASPIHEIVQWAEANVNAYPKNCNI